VKPTPLIRSIRHLNAGIATEYGRTVVQQVTKPAGVETIRAMNAQWTPDSWLQRTALQLPKYADGAEVQQVTQELTSLPPLVTAWEVDRLRAQLADAHAGQAFVMQGGDCSESFSDCNAATILGKLKVLIQMSLVLICGSKKKIVRIGRIAGQYAKPRSSDLECRSGDQLPSYRGDLVNQIGFTAKERRPDPQLMLRAYERSALTINYIRALSEGGFADLHHPENWDLDFVRNTPGSRRYQQLLASLSESVRFMEAVSPGELSQLSRVDFFTSHEGLHLPFEQAMTRTDQRQRGWYNLGAHTIWVGDRTRAIDGAHIEYFRGLQNPIGVKIGNTISPDELLDLVRVLNPDDIPGRLTLIHRFGATRIQTRLPALAEAVTRAGCCVLWSCDPMHGNTHSARNGIKTRSFDDITSEIITAFRIHKEVGSRLSGIHLELTGEDVTECIGGPGNLTESDLARDYRSMVDPRLNYEQAMEIAFLIAEQMV
jgi:3-deoxy-7-phosphoheptulonate synthase